MKFATKLIISLAGLLCLALEVEPSRKLDGKIQILKAISDDYGNGKKVEYFCRHTVNKQGTVNWRKRQDFTSTLASKGDDTAEEHQNALCSYLTKHLFTNPENAVKALNLYKSSEHMTAKPHKKDSRDFHYVTRRAVYNRGYLNWPLFFRKAYRFHSKPKDTIEPIPKHRPHIPSSLQRRLWGMPYILSSHSWLPGKRSEPDRFYFATKNGDKAKAARNGNSEYTEDQILKYNHFLCRLPGFDHKTNSKNIKSKLRSEFITEANASDNMVFQPPSCIHGADKVILNDMNAESRSKRRYKQHFFKKWYWPFYWPNFKSSYTARSKPKPAQLTHSLPFKSAKTQRFLNQWPFNGFSNLLRRKRK